MCHVSVGHVARAIEEVGIPTVSVYIQAFAHYAEAMRVPRTVVVPHAMGRPMGPPGDARRQREVIEAALALLDGATENGAVTRLEGSYRPGS